jgi:hypothetical protein
MIAAEALSQLAARLTEALHHPVELGTGATVEGPVLRITVHSMQPVPDVSKMTGRHVADQKSTLSWVLQLLLKGEAEGVLARARLVEAAASDIDSRPVLGAEGWRADMALETDPEWARGDGPAVGVRLRVALA